MAKIKWDKDKVQGILSWKKENNATWEEAAKHFKLPQKLLQSAHHRFFSTKYKGVKVPKKIKKPQSMMEIALPSAPAAQQSKLAVFVISPNQIQDFMAALWE